MNLLPKHKEEFSKKEYWDSFFKKRGNKSFEWYGEYPELCAHLHKYINSKNDILIVGCGNSTLGNDLYDVGYKNITSIDISNVVIRQMVNLNEKRRPEMKFLQMDATKVNFENEKFDVIIDKGTLDALMPDNSTSTTENIIKYFDEINRILKGGGKYVCVSLLQEHILNILITYFHNCSWLFKIIRCHEAEEKAMNQNETVFPVFMIVCTKLYKTALKTADIFLELSVKGQKAEKPVNVKTLISDIQQSSFLCSHLKNTTISEKDVISFDIFQANNTSPRYTVHVVDLPFDRNNFKYAAFIVPQGREAEWLFSTVEGRSQLAKMSQHNRLAIITMHRNQTYGSLDDVKAELNDIVQKLAPADGPDKIPFLSINSDVGERIIKYQGNSKFSGDYVIEDVMIDGTKYRRLYYLQSQSIIQSEAQLKIVKSRRGKAKEIVNTMTLTCKHHLYMIISAYLTCNKLDSSLVVVGLGGGGLCTFLHKLLPKITIRAVEIDEDMLKIASEWFGFQQDDNLTVKIIDGLEFLENSCKTDKKYEAILFDVDSKDTTIGMSCPPEQFLEDDVLDNVINSLSDEGIFVLNLVIRDDRLRAPTIQKLERKFQTLAFYGMEEDLNEVIVGFKRKISKEDLLKDYKSSADGINKFMKSNGVSNDDLVDVATFLDRLKIE